MEAQQNNGEIVAEGRNDILAKVITKKEHGGCVRAVGSGITNKEYFGFNKPAPPKELHSVINRMHTKMMGMEKKQNYMMSFIMTCCQLNQEQLCDFMTKFGDCVGQGMGGGKDFGSDSHLSDSTGQKEKSGNGGKGSSFMPFASLGVQDVQFELVTSSGGDIVDNEARKDFITNEEHDNSEEHGSEKEQVHEPGIKDRHTNIDDCEPYVVQLPDSEAQPTPYNFQTSPFIEVYPYS